MFPTLRRLLWSNSWGWLKSTFRTQSSFSYVKKKFKFVSRFGPQTSRNAIKLELSSSVYLWTSSKYQSSRGSVMTFQSRSTASLSRCTCTTGEMRQWSTPTMVDKLQASTSLSNSSCPCKSSANLSSSSLQCQYHRIFTTWDGSLRQSSSSLAKNLSRC